MNGQPLIADTDSVIHDRAKSWFKTDLDAFREGAGSSFQISNELGYSSFYDQTEKLRSKL